ncbi:hypothetical protein Cch01nite_33220 [Cellulomonas chitinilytica]|uniref:Uncharacterized protein n=1 Tax=Cellulomonas chitinilytica TaxID=398759 RepID=A0A919U117_9CELL|nr:hypothetical protein [Cellulomonas chitinilytica]GIG22598.1 hypothetical protein Cch01nite_33220 [Cellulomonas chitinilytica]
MNSAPGAHPTRTPRPAVAALGVGAVLVLAACGSQPVAEPPAATPAPVVAPSGTGASPEPDAFVALTDESAAAEYRAAVDAIELPLPDGLDYPAALPAAFLPTDGVVEQGAGRNVANFTWLCAWEDEYLTAESSDDARRVAHAAEMLEAWATGPFYTQVMSDPDHGWVSNVLVPMRQGDSSGIEADHQQLCREFPTVAGTGSR